MSLQEKNSELESVTQELATLVSAHEGLTGTEKGQSTKNINILTAKKEELEADIATLESDEGDTGSTESDEGDTGEKKTKTDLDELESGDEVIVKNVGKFMLHDDGIRFPVGIEQRAPMSSFIRSQVKAGLFVLLGK